MDLVEYEDLLTEPSNQRKNVTFGDGSQQQEPSTDDDSTFRERVLQLELRLAEQTGQHNEEVRKLHEKVTKLQSSFEKQELLRQKLEYELTLSKQDISKGKRKAIEKEETANKQIGELENEIRQLNIKLESSNHFITEYKQSTIADLTNATGTRRILETANIELKKQNELLHEEKLAAENLLVTWKRKHKEITDKCELVEKQRNDHADTIRQLTKESEFASVREDEFTTNAQELQNKIKNIEKNIEAERAAHLETKFNTEVLQLKIRDTENLLEMEKARLQECRNGLQSMDKKYRELEEVYSKEKAESSQVKIQYEKCRDELNTEKQEKNQYLGGITDEVKNYGKHLKEIMSEFDEAKKKLSSAETAKESITKELKFLLNNYKVVAEFTSSPVRKDGWKFSAATEQLRRILESYHNKLFQLETKYKEAAETIVKLTDECATHQEVAWSKERALEEAERLVRDAQNGLSQCQVKCAAYEEKVARLKVEDNQLKHLLVARDERISVLSQEVYRNNLDIDQQFQNTMSTFQVIYELLMANESAESVMTLRNQLTMKELKDVILNKIKDGHQNHRTMTDRITMLKDELEKTKTEIQQHKSGLKRLQKLNSQVLSQAEKSLTEGQQLREKGNLRYEEEIALLKSKLNDSEKKLEAFLKKCDGVPMDNLTSVIDKFDQYEQYKLSSVVLINTLTSSLWGLLFQHHLYAYQKKLLIKTVNRLTVIRSGVLEIARTLQNSMSGTNNLEEFPKSGIFRFRQIVIVVLASNRLLRIAKCSCSFKLYRKSYYGYNGLMFYEGNGINNSVSDKTVKLLQWLTTEQNDQKITHELQSILKGPLEKIVSSLSTFYGNMIQKTSDKFKSSSVLSLKNDPSKGSLLQLLGEGLTCILQSDKYTNLQWATSINIVEVLRKQILDFTANLHQGEELKKSLTTDRDRYRDSRNKYRHEVNMERSEVATLKAQEHALNKQIEEFKIALGGMVHKEEMDEVCTDLKSALKREEELQMLFEKQMQQITQMETRIAGHEVSYNNKNNEFTAVMKTLKTSQADVLRRDDAIQDLKNRVADFKQERCHLQKCIDCQEEKLESFICDREILARYMRRTSSVIYRTKKEMHQSVETVNMAVKELLPQDPFIVGNKKENPEMQLVQNTVKVFFDVQREALMRISMLLTEKHEVENQKKSLEQELTAHQLHIRSLKDRVSRLFTQDVSMQKNVLESGAISLPMISQEEVTFIPLQEH